jgi:hypothetical protein
LWVQERSNPVADQVAEAQDLKQANGTRSVDVVEEALNVKKYESTCLASPDRALGVVGEAQDGVNRTVVVVAAKLVGADYPETVRLMEDAMGNHLLKEFPAAFE